MRWAAPGGSSMAQTLASAWRTGASRGSAPDQGAAHSWAAGPCAHAAGSGPWQPDLVPGSPTWPGVRGEGSRMRHMKSGATSARPPPLASRRSSPREEEAAAGRAARRAVSRGGGAASRGDGRVVRRRRDRNGFGCCGSGNGLGLKSGEGGVRWRTTQTGERLDEKPGAWCIGCWLDYSGMKYLFHIQGTQ